MNQSLLEYKVKGACLVVTVLAALALVSCPLLLAALNIVVCASTHAGSRNSTLQSWTMHKAAEEQRHEKLVLLDTDEKSLPMVLNAVISLAEFYNAAELAQMVHVLCFDTASCAFVTQAGFKVVGRGIALAVRQGFNQRLDNATYSGNWLDDICLAREQALLHLLSMGRLVLRSDNDVCFLKDPFVLQQKTGAGIVISAQPLAPTTEGVCGVMIGDAT